MRPIILWSGAGPEGTSIFYLGNLGIATVTRRVESFDQERRTYVLQEETWKLRHPVRLCGYQPCALPNIPEVGHWVTYSPRRDYGNSDCQAKAANKRYNQRHPRHNWPERDDICSGKSDEAD